MHCPYQPDFAEQVDMEPANILVIEDDELVARTIAHSLRGEFRVALAASGAEGLKHARSRPPDLVILDVLLPGMDGFAVCRQIRADPLLADTPILFLTARARDEDKIEGLRAGADDYLVKPFNVDELILRLQAILRRSRGRGAVAAPAGATPSEHAAHLLAVGDYILDLRKHELFTPQGVRLPLTPLQFDLLQVLMRRPEDVFSPARLLEEVWNYPPGAGSPELVRVHIQKLRARIEADPEAPAFLRTVPGYGYTVNPSLSFPGA